MTTYRAISIWEPNASLIIAGLKPIETRTHDNFISYTPPFNYEPIAIHAAKNPHWLATPRGYAGTRFESHLAELYSSGDINKERYLTIIRWYLKKLDSEEGFPSMAVLGTVEAAFHRALTMEDSDHALRDTLKHTTGHRLTSAFAEWWMGWPIGHTALQPSATDKSPCKQHSHGNSSKGQNNELGKKDKRKRRKKRKDLP